MVEDGEGGQVGLAVWREGAAYRTGEPKFMEREG